MLRMRLIGSVLAYSLLSACGGPFPLQQGDKSEGKQDKFVNPPSAIPPSTQSATSSQTDDSTQTNSSTEFVTICSIEVDQGIYDTELNFLLGKPLDSFHSSAQNDPRKTDSLGVDLSIEGSDQNVDQGDVITVKLSPSSVDEVFNNNVTYIDLGKIIEKNEDGSTTIDVALEGRCTKEGTLKVSEMWPAIMKEPAKRPATGSFKICTIEIDKAPFDGLIGKAWAKLFFTTSDFSSLDMMPPEEAPNGLVKINDKIAIFDNSPDNKAIQANGTARIVLNEKRDPSSVPRLTGSCPNGGTLKVSAMTAN